MSVLNQIILGVLLMVTLVVVALMVRVYSRTESSNKVDKQTELSDEQNTSIDEDE
jgi:hypothetical protein